MARLRGEGAQDWLNQQLTSPWHGHQTVASGLSNEIILNIRERWSQLESSVRLGVLFSLISLKKAQQVELRDRCQELIDHACSDPDDWVRLVSQMLKDYPSEGTLRFNVEQFADQAQLGSLLKSLTDHISQNGIKFHPKEFAYLSESVCKAGQGRDPKTKKYPAMTGPSLQTHFTLIDDSDESIHGDRSERLRKMADQASPAVTLPGGILSSSSASLGSVLDSSVGPGSNDGTSSAEGGNSASGGTAAGAGSVQAIGSNGSLAPGVAATTGPGATAPGGSGTAPGLGGNVALGPGGVPARPVKSSGLFVKSKPSGTSFLRNNAPRPMPLPRNPSLGQIPTIAASRGNPKVSRIQILDLQQGNEIMQSMNDARIRKEQDEKREKELKKEQRLQEIELKKQQDADKKAQLLREKEEKKKEREDAKRAKEKAKQEREEQAAAALAERERERERERLEQERLREQQSQAGEIHVLDDDDPNEASLSSVPARKKSRLHSSDSRRGSRDGEDDDDYDGIDNPSSSNGRPEPINTGQRDYASNAMSPTTPGLTSTYARQSLYDTEPAGQQTPGRQASNAPTDSYFQHQHQYQSEVVPGQSLQSPSSVVAEHPTLFQDTNLLRPEDRQYISLFLQGHPVVRPNENATTTQIVMNQEQVQDANGKIMYELIVIEMNFETGEWRKIKRRRQKPHQPDFSASNGS
ncbi:hypothetical protein EMPS_10985 [Entomortierella parvispora]|uniref:NELF-A N-terminal domain-containing protein n=1 Tax=Entomortierella parvispora TaxID=205924 RepID=A0A9P3M1I7_9FUNG|nr:hypothetical protein EMPS_10985 [Entomortierella parvispora]